MSNVEKAGSFEDVVRGKVKQVLFDSMPDEQIDKLIKKEMESYFDGPKDHWGRTDSEKPSPFKRLVFEEMLACLKPRLNLAIEKFLSQNQEQSGTSPDVTGLTWEYKFTEDFVKALAPAAMHSVTQAIIQNALTSFRSALQRGY